MRPATLLLAVALLAQGCTSRFTALPGDTARLTHGVAVGDVTATRAVVWGRCDRRSRLSVRWQARGKTAAQTLRTQVGADHDFVGKLVLEGLRPGTAYGYTTWCGDDETAAKTGRFSTTPEGGKTVPVRFVFGGDLGGQNACRDRQRGYPIFDTVRAQSPDFFVALGDLIYADDPCKSVGRYGNEQIPGPPTAALNAAAFGEYWKYNRSDPSFQQVLASMPMYSVWDDHEIKNDAGPQQDTLPFAPHVHLLEPALQAFLDYQPMLPPADRPKMLYGSFRWGRNLELFILDLRQYRDANLAPDSAAKTMLGEEQRRWLLDALRRSDATWKIIVSSVPLSVPTGTPGTGHDGWTGFGKGDGFEHERQAILRVMRESTPRNYVWITTDVHFGAVFRYRPFADDPAFIFHEVISGPLNAGIFPKEEYDRGPGTERLFLYAPYAPIADYDEALAWFNFGSIAIAADGALTARLINGRGESAYEMTVVPR